MSAAEILEIDDLMRITGLTKPGDIERVLTQQGIKIFRGRKGVIWTTMALVNHAGGIKTADNNEKYNAEETI